MSTACLRWDLWKKSFMLEGEPAFDFMASFLAEAEELAL